MRRRFEEYFDYIRDPQLKTDLFLERDVLRLELGALRDKYFVSPDGRIDWPRVVEAVSR